jgi:hypothetical protein
MRLSQRRYHPAGLSVVARARGIGRRRRTIPGDTLRMRGGNLVRSLTPRQAVLWLMHLDEVVDQLPRSVAPHFTTAARRRLARALRARVANREGFSRRRV